MFNVRRSTFFALLLILLAAANAWAQGHGLCNNSGGFRLTKNYISNNSELYEEIAPDILAKLNSGEDLTADEIEVFEDAYKTVAGDLYDKFRQEIGLINESQSSSLNIRCVDCSEGVDLMLSTDIPPDQAAEKVYNSSDFVNRQAAQAANTSGRDKSYANIMMNRVLDHSPNIRINGEPIPETLTEFIQNTPSIDQYSHFDLLELFKENLPPEVFAAINESVSVEDVYKSIQKIEVGDTGIVLFNKSLLKLEGQSEKIETLGHALTIQRTSPETFFIFDTADATSGFIKTDGEVGRFQDQLKKSITDYYNDFRKKLIDAIHAPDASSEAGMARIDLIEKDMKQKLLFYSTAEIENVIIPDDSVKIISHSPPP